MSSLGGERANGERRKITDRLTCVLVAATARARLSGTPTNITPLAAKIDSDGGVHS
jgi:hypothetical protein